MLHHLPDPDELLYIQGHDYLTVLNEVDIRSVGRLTAILTAEPTYNGGQRWTLPVIY